ncbi:hypothetical protein BH09BAC5_BH09BAC5_23280 [soil metagenome]
MNLNRLASLYNFHYCLLRFGVNLSKYCTIVILIIFGMGSCNSEPDLVESKPDLSLSQVPGGYCYGLTTHLVVFQQPNGAESCSFVSCDSIIGDTAYQSLLSFLGHYPVQYLVISKNKDTYLFIMPHISNPGSYDAYAYFKEENLTKKLMLQRANMLSFLPIMQSRKLSNHWLRVTPFDGRNKDYLGLFDFE